MYKRILIYTVPLIVLFNLKPLDDRRIENTINYPFEYIKQEKWVDSVFRTLTLDEKIGQLFMVAAYSNKKEAHYKEIEKLVKNQKVGGLIFFQGSPYQQALLTNRYQAQAEVPLMIAMDAEWGLGMRLDSTLSYPRQMTLGALRNDTLIYQMGRQIAEQAKRLGVHINFAPVVDINSNPLNPVIGNRSFGENKEKVAQKSILYMRGMQEAGLMANAKHFPGHGDTESDSHFTLPVIQHDRQRLDSLELYPFKALIKEGVGSMMVAHLYLTQLDERSERKKRKEMNIPATLSKNIVSGLLKNDLGFQGLVFTDALNMKGVSAFYEPGEMDIMALKAGNDVLLFPVDVKIAIKAIKRAVKKREMEEEEIDKKVKKILRAKYKMQLHRYRPIQTVGLTDSLNQFSYKRFIDLLHQKANTLVANKDSLLPFRHLDLENFASLTLGDKALARGFQHYLDNYVAFEHHHIPTDSFGKASVYQSLVSKLADKSIVVVAVGNINKKKKKNYGIDPWLVPFLEKLQEKTKVVVCVFGIPYSLEQFKNIHHVICAYEEKEVAIARLPQQLFGALPFEGVLPVSVGEVWKEGIGLTTQPNGRFEYTYPEDAQMNGKKLQKIDKIVEEAIKRRMTPSAQVVVARKGKVVWHKAYGYHGYGKNFEVSTESLYDLASITKVAATTQALMFLYEQGKLNLAEKASTYLPELKKTNKKNITIKQLLLHQAGLQSFIPYWVKTLDKNRHLSSEYYSPYPTEAYSLQVANHLYAITNMEEVIWEWTLQSKVKKANRKGEYRYLYSDLSFYLLKRVAESLLKQPIEEFLQQNYYTPLGASSLMYNPLQIYPTRQIVPTELEENFRSRKIQGTVHDPGAALLGGVGGHAGLFGNANDLAKLGQMTLQQGFYGGVRFFQPATVELFTSRISNHSRRGLGWDKAPDQGNYSYIPTFASASSYGHSGFTGTVLWVDPKYDLVVVILANRVYPKSRNSKYVKEHVRRRIQDAIYLAMEDVQFDVLAER